MTNASTYFIRCELKDLYDIFVKKIQPMRHNDWLIHKKLNDARRIYVVQARTQGKTEFLRHCQTLSAEGKDVITVTQEDLRKARQYTTNDNWDFNLLRRFSRMKTYEDWVNAHCPDEHKSWFKLDYDADCRLDGSIMWPKVNPYILKGDW